MEARAALIRLLVLTVFRAHCLHLRTLDKTDDPLTKIDGLLTKTDDISLLVKTDDFLTPQEKIEARRQAYEKEFVVELNMTEAHDSGKLLGVQLDVDTDFTEVSIMKVRKNGLLEDWNQANPHNEVHVGDQIVRVNDILWHHNSIMFTERIKNQFKASREYKEGAKRLLTLYLQRPRKSILDQTRFQSQRQDLHRQLYSREFIAEIPLLRDFTMGWELNITADWVPISIREIKSEGLVAIWNKVHPEYMIFPGDEIIEVNRIVWHHNSKTFGGRLQAQYDNFLSLTNASRGTMSLRIQRPRSVVERLEDRAFSKMFYVNLSWTNGSQPIGWTLEANATDPVIVTNISDGSVLSTWNSAHPEQRMAVGDRILKANKAQWHHNKTNFASNLRKFVDAAEHVPEGANRNLTLFVQRYAKFSYERGWQVEIPAKVGTNMGLQVSALDDELPVTIAKIRPLGAVAAFNEDSPENAVSPGDQIFKVNDVLWQQDSREFEKRLEGQFTRSKRTGKMLLWVQRPEGLEVEQQPSEYLEYSVELPVSPSKAIGWDLNATEGTPVSLSKVLKVGSVRKWNDANPLKDIQVGDQIVQVDNNVWRNNTRKFMQTLTKQLDDASKGIGKKSISVLFHRVWAAVPSTDHVLDSNVEDKLGEDDVMGAEQ